MKNSLKKLESFSNSTYNSTEEKQFMEETMSSFYEEKLKRKYKDILSTDYDLNQEAKDNEVKSKSKYLKILILIISIVALSIAAFFVFQLSKNSSQNVQVADNIDSYYTEIDFNTRGVISEEEKLVKLAQFYDQKDFKSVVSTFESIESLNLDGKYLHATGVSYINTDQLDKAIEVWSLLLETEESKFTYHNIARFFMGRAMLESGKNAEKAKEYLSQVSESSKYYDQAQSLLKK